jgi:AraC family transcriptional regulator
MTQASPPFTPQPARIQPVPRLRLPFVFIIRKNAGTIPASVALQTAIIAGNAFHETGHVMIKVTFFSPIPDRRHEMTLRLKLKNCKFTMFNLKAGQADEFHGHEDVYQLSIPLAGKSIMQHEQTRRHMDSPDSRMLLSPGQRHRHLAEDGDARILLITVKRDFLRKVVADRLQGFESEVFFDPWGQDHSSGILIQQVEQSLLRSLQHPLDGMELEEFEWKLVSFMLSVHQGTHSDKWFPSSPPPIKHPSLRKGIEYLHAHLSSPVTLDDLCKVTGISKYHLIRLFQKHVGTTPGQYLRNQKLQLAEQLLRHSRKTILSIALESGFNSLSSFERAFRKKFGISPSGYRKRLSP